MRARKLPWIAVALVFAVASQALNAQESDEIYEIRSYHYEPSLLADYKTWIEEDALPYLTENLDVVGFWIGSGDPAEVSGKALDELGSANVTWIIRWPSMEVRSQERPGVFAADEWKEIASRVPGGREAYLRVEARFASSVY